MGYSINSSTMLQELTNHVEELFEHFLIGKVPNDSPVVGGSW
jgi:hypothetical protein